MTEQPRPASTSGSTPVLRGPCHAISVEIAGRGWVDATFTCTATEGADCRLTCPAGCPEWDAADHEHTLVDAGECVALPWLDAEEWSEQYAGPRTELRAGPVVLEFTGDGYTWAYAENL